jgi:hypothetical protein
LGDSILDVGGSIKDIEDSIWDFVGSNNFWSFSSYFFFSSSFSFRGVLGWVSTWNYLISYGGENISNFYEADSICSFIELT